jgi:hypothetical protein
MNAAIFSSGILSTADVVFASTSLTKCSYSAQKFPLKETDIHIW